LFSEFFTDVKLSVCALTETLGVVYNIHVLY